MNTTTSLEGLFLLHVTTCTDYDDDGADYRIVDTILAHVLSISANLFSRLQ